MKKSLSDRHIRTSLDIYDPNILQKKQSKGSLQNSSEEEEIEYTQNSIFPGVDISKIENESMVMNKTEANDIKNANNFIENYNPNDKNDYNFKRPMTVVKIKEGILQKKSPWFHYNTRKVVLDSTPRIEYIDPKTNKIKGSIYLTKICEAEFKVHDVFLLKTPKRIFKFKTDEYQAGIWCRVINESIQKY